MKPEPESDTDDYWDLEEIKKERRTHRRKRRKLDTRETGKSQGLTLRPLLDQLDDVDDGTSFDDIIDRLLPEYLQVRATIQENSIEQCQNGTSLRPLTRSEVSSFVDALTTREDPSLSERIIKRKLKLAQERRRSGLKEMDYRGSSTATPLPRSVSLAAQPQVIDALYGIRTTPFENSFLSRLQGTRATKLTGVIAVDWETVTPWMSLLIDIREHHTLSHPEREQATEALAPIVYNSLQRCHLGQVHELLERSFWTGVNVSDSLDHSPERCTVVATYKALVVGVAILSSPWETYITYLAVKAGWDNSRIARSMLYHLIRLNPNKDITLHVSVNNSAMLLYNRFGFKAEEFVVGFYKDYLDSQSRASKNAFRLRLRQ